MNYSYANLGFNFYKNSNVKNSFVFKEVLLQPQNGGQHEATSCFCIPPGYWLQQEIFIFLVGCFRQISICL